jgi:hypothetical protein
MDDYGHAARKVAGAAPNPAGIRPLTTCAEPSIASAPGPPPRPRPVVAGAVTMLLMKLYPAREIAAAYGVSRATLYNWRDELLADPDFVGDLAARLGRR